MNQKNFSEVLIDQGLMGKNKDVRAEFKDAILFVCENVKAAESPANFFLSKVLSLLGDMTHVDPKHTMQYF